ncbi:hypothetical protein TNCT_97401 [Trichonephila clavata]|uniref:Uncharacterized protein n=1 Tax=Trichonephila clavata TaxID=2740835 RepID=A0A8X6K7F1_TRICU|nr:hypothetical protein TNCT_97401 [Trichonephila clavata]
MREYQERRNDNINIESSSIDSLSSKRSFDCTASIHISMNNFVFMKQETKSSRPGYKKFQKETVKSKICFSQRHKRYCIQLSGMSMI